MLYSELFASALKKLDRNEMATAVEVLIESSFAINRSQFWMGRNQTIRDANGLRRFRRAFARLLAGEPLAYILGKKEFYGETFAVSPAVLIPRPETELLVEKALELLGQRPARILDIGSGSGCIAITLARLTRSHVVALEKSRPALRVLKRNIERFGVQSRVRPLAGDLYPGRAAAFRMIVANPPYLSRQDWLEAPREIRLHEPKTALVSGRAGTEILARIIAGAPRFLEPGSHLLLEIGQGQRRALCGFLKAAGLRELECVRDYAGIERVVVAQME
ncbi:MAG: peptide chain release factor N(5)-glutamine methyltransferase [Acidobacteriota bacterium]|nr:peptide chain release factor N(5)-glutamine methyltransferase [Acidobacteriota bacterium]